MNDYHVWLYCALEDALTFAENYRLEKERLIMTNEPHMLPSRLAKYSGLQVEGYVSLFEWEEGFSPATDFGAYVDSGVPVPVTFLADTAGYAAEGVRLGLATLTRKAQGIYAHATITTESSYYPLYKQLTEQGRLLFWVSACEGTPLWSDEHDALAAWPIQQVYLTTTLYKHQRNVVFGLDEAGQIQASRLTENGVIPLEPATFEATQASGVFLQAGDDGKLTVTPLDDAESLEMVKKHSASIAEYIRYKRGLADKS